MLALGAGPRARLGVGGAEGHGGVVGRVRVRMTDGLDAAPCTLP